MFNKSHKKLNSIFKSSKLDKVKNGCRNNMATIIVFTILMAIFLGYQITTFTGYPNLDIDDLIYDINIEQELTTPFTDNDLTNAREKLQSVGLTTLANQYIITNLESNTQTPTSSLMLTKAEFASLLVPIYYAKYGKSTTIYEIDITQKTDSTTDYAIKITSSSKLNFRLYDIKIDEQLYITEYYDLKITTPKSYEITYNDFDLLNVNKKYISKQDIEESKTDENFIELFVHYIFITNNETKSYITQLNYNNFNMQDSNIILSNN